MNAVGKQIRGRVFWTIKKSIVCKFYSLIEFILVPNVYKIATKIFIADQFKTTSKEKLLQTRAKKN